MKKNTNYHFYRGRGYLRPRWIIAGNILGITLLMGPLFFLLTYLTDSKLEFGYFFLPFIFILIFGPVIFYILVPKKATTHCYEKVYLSSKGIEIVKKKQIISTTYWSTIKEINLGLEPTLDKEAYLEIRVDSISFSFDSKIKAMMIKFCNNERIINMLIDLPTTSRKYEKWIIENRQVTK